MGRTTTIAPMREIPVGVRARLRDLTLGPIAWGMWQWTHQDGSCWAAVVEDSGDVVAWAAVSMELDDRPVVGCYVAEGQRGRGLATYAVTSLLSSLKSDRVLHRGDALYATTSRWPRYTEICNSLGLRCLEWK